MSELLTQKHRYFRGESEEVDMNCPFCLDNLEDECHFLFRCKKSVFRPSNLKNVERGCQPSILCRKFNDERRSASKIKQLAWFVFKGDK